MVEKLRKDRQVGIRNDGGEARVALASR